MKGVRKTKSGLNALIFTKDPVTGAEIHPKLELTPPESRHVSARLATLFPELPAPTPPTPINPSGQPCPIGSLPGWRQVFVDDFNVPVPLGSFPSAVSAKWNAYPYREGWRDTKGAGSTDPTKGGWYHPGKVLSVHGGVLDYHLHTELVDGHMKHLVAAPVPKLLGHEWGWGMKAGRYAVRFRADPLPSYKMAWLLWPDAEGWPENGEIDWPEGDLAGEIQGFMHHQGATEQSKTQEWARSHEYFDAWHTAVIEWEAGRRCALYMDGALLTDASGGKSEWTSRVPATPMHWVLQCETTTSYPPNAEQGHVLIDWISVWVPA